MTRKDRILRKENSAIVQNDRYLASESSDSSSSSLNLSSNYLFSDLSSDAESSEFEGWDSDSRVSGDDKPNNNSAGYDSDSSTEEHINTIGSVKLLEKYMYMPHIGYDLDGKRIFRPASASTIDALIEQIEHTDFAATDALDIETGQPIKLSAEETELLQQVSHHMMPTKDFNPYPDYVDYFTGKVLSKPLKYRKTIREPSKYEQKRILALVKAIRLGRIKIPTREEKELIDRSNRQLFDLWEKTQTNKRASSVFDLKIPKLHLPGHEESYNPPEYYLELNLKNTENWKPVKYKSLRLVPAWKDFIKERFERCLDLYLAPRTRKREQIDPESLLPKLPPAHELKPFPELESLIFKGHVGKVRACSFGCNYLASGGDDGKLMIWDIKSGKNIWSTKLGSTINTMAWNPLQNIKLLAVGCDDKILLIHPPIFSDEDCKATLAALENAQREKKYDKCYWSIKPFEMQSAIVAEIVHQGEIKYVEWHRKGDYFVNVFEINNNCSIKIHQLSQTKSQTPFSRQKGKVQIAKFHPKKPWLFVASQQYIRVYDLSKGQQLRILKPGVQWISSFDIHSTGDHVIVTSYDRKVVWLDLDAGDKPYKAFKFHTEAVRLAKFHPKKPLLITCSDDGTIRVLFANVVSDLMTRPNIIPLNILASNQKSGGLGILDACWTESTTVWLVTAGANGVLKLWT